MAMKSRGQRIERMKDWANRVRQWPSKVFPDRLTQVSGLAALCDELRAANERLIIRLQQRERSVGALQAEVDLLQSQMAGMMDRVQESQVAIDRLNQRAAQREHTLGISESTVQSL